jgi:hypothetical protein
MTNRDDVVRRINAALDHIDKHGDLVAFSSSTEAERQTLISAATAQGMLTWNVELKRYELSKIARKWLEAFYSRRARPTR